jgi:hypothetical protein
MVDYGLFLSEDSVKINADTTPRPAFCPILCFCLRSQSVKHQPSSFVTLIQYVTTLKILQTLVLNAKRTSRIGPFISLTLIRHISYSQRSQLSYTISLVTASEMVQRNPPYSPLENLIAMSPLIITHDPCKRVIRDRNILKFFALYDDELHELLPAADQGQRASRISAERIG